MQWVGRPGPRYQPDRNGRKPAPLAVNGRLFGQGLKRIVAIDACNGTILWSLEIPDFGRFNMPRDCGNWCADADYVYAAARDKCWQIDAASGDVVAFHDLVPGRQTDWTWDWGYVADGGRVLVGSAVKAGSAFMSFWGHKNWYDSTTGEPTFKICSDNLFAIHKASGKPEWTYADGVIINSTISIAGGCVYFVECRNAAVMDSDVRRVGMPELWADPFLVAVDVRSGRKRWERPLDVAPGIVVFFLACAEGRLVLVSSDTSYHVYALDAADGTSLWEAGFDWIRDNHGGHMSRPAIVGGKVFVRPRVMDLATGEVLPGTWADAFGGCGTYAFTSRAAVYRDSNVTMWDFDADRTTSWHRLRPGCWLSAIPACGMILSPEAGGGCTCGRWMETSIAFRPRT